MAVALTWLLMPSVTDRSGPPPSGDRDRGRALLHPPRHRHRRTCALAYDLDYFTLAQGASTITEQLAKNLYLNGDDRAPWRKLEDALLAMRLRFAAYRLRPDEGRPGKRLGHTEGRVRT